MSTRRTVLFDVDGVIADFTTRVLDVVHEECGRWHHEEEVDRWSIKDALGLPDEHWRNVVRRIVEPGFASSILPYHGAIEAVVDIAKRHEVFFVTSPWRSSPTWVHDRDEWLVRCFGKALGSRVIHTAHKTLVLGDVLIEDKIETLDAWERAGEASTWHGCRRAIVIDRPYNRIMSHRHLLRVKTLAEVVDFSHRVYFKP